MEEQAFVRVVQGLCNSDALKNMEALAQCIESHDMEKIAENYIYKALKEALKERKDEKITAGTELYRGRIIDFRGELHGICQKSDSLQFEGYNELASGAPPLGISQAGRSNIVGASYLYLAEDEYTACAEIKPQLSQYVSVAKFVVQSSLSLFDFANFSGYCDVDLPIQNEYISLVRKKTNFERIEYSFKCPAYTPDVYLVSQFLTEMVRKEGYDGICYCSVYSGKKNYTLFHFSDKYIKFKDSRPLFVSQGSLNILDINESRIIPPAMKTEVFSEKSILSIKEQLQQTIKAKEEKKNGQA